MDAQEKLRVLVQHWLDHNEQHTGEYRKRIDQAGQYSADLAKIIEHSGEITHILQKILSKMFPHNSSPGE